eukprot:3353514-Pyramimonas_sp.AAC.1
MAPKRPDASRLRVLHDEAPSQSQRVAHSSCCTKKGSMPNRLLALRHIHSHRDRVLARHPSNSRRH